MTTIKHAKHTKTSKIQLKIKVTICASHETDVLKSLKCHYVVIRLGLESGIPVGKDKKDMQVIFSMEICKDKITPQWNLITKHS